MTRVTRSIPAVLALLMLAIPAHALPCCCDFAARGEQAGVHSADHGGAAKPQESKPAKRSCCSGKSGRSAARPQEPAGQSAQPERPQGCSNCNSPCCLGQTVVSTAAVAGGVDLRLVDGGSALPEPFDLPTSVALEGLLRPPRA